MKLTTKQLRRIIKEELQSVLAEQDSDVEEFLKKRMAYLQQMDKYDDVRKPFLDVSKAWEDMFYSNASNTVEGVAAQVSDFVRDYIDSSQHPRLLKGLKQAADKKSREDLKDAVGMVLYTKFPQGVPAHIATLHTDFAMRNVPGQSSTNTERSTDQDHGEYFGKYDMAQDTVHRGYLANWLGVEGEGPEHPIKYLQDRFKMSNKDARFEAARLMLLLALGMDIRGAEFGKANITKDQIRKALDEMLLNYIDVPEGGNETWKKGSKRAFENALLNAVGKLEGDNEDLYGRGFGQKLRSFLTGRGFRQ